MNCQGTTCMIDVAETVFIPWGFHFIFLILELINTVKEHVRPSRMMIRKPVKYSKLLIAPRMLSVSGPEQCLKLIFRFLTWALPVDNCKWTTYEIVYYILKHCIDNYSCTSPIKLSIDSIIESFLYNNAWVFNATGTNVSRLMILDNCQTNNKLFRILWKTQIGDTVKKT